MIIQATAESLIGSIFFALFLAVCGLVVGYITCRRQASK
jgi:ABC-type Fe3+ transport system permease subunit